MRLRLLVKRDRQPPSKVLWPIPDHDQEYTIAELLADINESIPLASTNRGLKHCVVEHGLYECIHHHEVRSICRDDDELVIRQFSQAQIQDRIRTKLRHGQSELYYGAPTGRSSDYVLVRPENELHLHQQQQLEDRDGRREDENGGVSGYIEDARSKSKDSDHVNGEADEVSSDDDSTEDSSDESDTETRDMQHRPSLAVANNDNHTPLPDLTTTQLANVQRTEAVEPDHQGTAASAGVASHTISPAQPDNNGSAGEPGPVASAIGLPFQGSSSTKGRNRRRKDSKRLNFLKTKGLLPQNATIQDLRQRNDLPTMFGAHGNGSPETDRPALNQPVDAIHTLPRPLAGTTQSQNVQLVDAETTQQITKAGDADSPPEEMSSREQPEADSEPLPVPTQNKTIRQQPDQHLVVTAPQSEQKNSTITTSITQMIPPAVSRRAKLDLGASKRLVFGSLGFRAPKTAEEKERLRAQQQNEGNEPSNQAENADHATTRPALEDLIVEDWASKLNVTAVECCDEGVTLTAPPFPFEQRWDPQYARNGKKRKSSGQANKAAKKRRSEQYLQTEHHNEVDHYSGNGYEDDDDDHIHAAEDDDGNAHFGLDGTDDVSGVQADDIHLPTEQEVYLRQVREDLDDFPELPDDLTTLPDFQAASAGPGQCVYFSQLDLSRRTKWQPEMVVKTYLLCELCESGKWLVKIPMRDLPEKKFDAAGHRKLEGFEMGGSDPTYDGEQNHDLDAGRYAEVDLSVLPDLKTDESFV